jgi:hypothetical protein
MQVIETGERSLIAGEEERVDESTKVIQHSPEKLPNFTGVKFEKTNDSELQQTMNSKIDGKRTPFLIQQT